MNVKMFQLSALTILGVAGCAMCSLNADVVDTVWNAQRARAEREKPANAARLRALGAKGDVAFFAVPAMSDVMRLDDTWPVDGSYNDTVRCVLAQDEFESCSFELFAFKDLDQVELKVDLPVPHDLRVVKLWFQNGNAWVSYFDDVGLKLTPELLLHDEDLVRVTKGKTPANYGRQLVDGKETYVWMSAPRGLDAGVFSSGNAGFRDAPSMRPVVLEQNAFKQFFLTLHPPKDFKPGVYTGQVTVSRRGQKLAEIPLAVRVLPFALPMPRGYYDPSQMYLHSCMAAMPNLKGMIGPAGGDVEKAKKVFRAWMQSLYDHSVFHAPSINPDNAWCVPMLREIGFPLDYVHGPMIDWSWPALNFGGRLSYDHYRNSRDSAKKTHDFFTKVLGHSNVLCGLGDEQGAAFVTAHREFFKFFSQYGIKIDTSGHAPMYYKGAYAYGFYAMGGTPDAAYEQSRPWREVGLYPIGFYASQHTGSENPQFTRRQHGLLGWMNGLTMSFNYEWATGPFNDRASVLYKPMVIAYSNGDGLMETIEYAGFREACDDIRYGTYLKQLAQEAIDTKDAVKTETAKKALQYLALLDRETMDLNVVRMEMIEHILKLRKALGR